ncbi:MAG: NUDIX domain-containing protein [Lachnospiraceae bacterium]
MVSARDEELFGYIGNIYRGELSMYLEKYERYLGTGERNSAGLDLKTFLEEYNPRLYDTPANTVDNLIFTYIEDNGKKKLNRILLIKRGNHPSIGWWALPGGFVDFRENLEDAAARELEEETGLKGVKGVQLGSYGDYDRDPRTRIITTAYVFVEEEGKLVAAAGDDAADAGWFNFHVESAGETADSTAKVRRELYDISFECGDIRPTARVMVVTDSSNALVKKEYKIVCCNQIAADHAAIILNGIDYVNEHL